MIWIAAVLATFLFYKFVEKNHKIIFFKILGALTITGIISYAGKHAYDWWAEKHSKPDIQVSYSYHSTKASEKEKNSQADLLFSSLLANKESLLNNLDKENLNLVKMIIYPKASFKSDLFSVYAAREKEETTTELEQMDLLFGDADPEKTKILEKKLSLITHKRLEKYLVDLINDRNAAVTDQKKQELSLKIYTRLTSLPSELKVEYEKALKPWESYYTQGIVSLTERETEKLLKSISNLGAMSEISFSVCNNKSIPLLSYSFSVSGFEIERSTPHPLQKNDSAATTLVGDIIVKPKTCITVTWTGYYDMYNRYTVALGNAQWEEK